MPSDHIFSILGKKVPWRYTRLRGKADGWAYLKDPANQNVQERVMVNEKLTGRARLETEIHEFWHIANPTHSEEHVTHAARDLARILYALGYRLTGGRDG
jgi:hypothetical protein